MPRLTIIGAGLAGSILAAELAGSFEVTVIELQQASGKLVTPIMDIGHPAGISPHAGSGLGGSTALWNNGLIELEAEDYARWPIRAGDLLPYLSRAYPLLAGISREAVMDGYARLKAIHVARGIPADLVGNGLYYPQRRRNLWQSLQLAKRPVRVIFGRAKHLLLKGSQVSGVLVERPDGSRAEIQADYVIIAAGGLSTPLLIQETAQVFALSSGAAAGCYYIDHPMGMVAQIRLKTRLHDVWNYRERSLAGTLQTPLVVRNADGLKISVFLRPAVIVTHGHRRERVQSVLANLRNAPFNLSALTELATSLDDLREIISFKLGLHLPTDHYVLRLVASENPATHRSIRPDETTSGIRRDWTLTPAYKATIADLLNELISRLGGVVLESHFFDRWPDLLHTAAHHSGTCRMAVSPELGVCDSNCGVFGLRNAYICDGSVLPATGYANTGLTIAALALRLADHLRDRVAPNSVQNHLSSTLTVSPG